MGKIQLDLDRLSSLRADLDVINTRIEASIPPSLKAERSDLSSECKILEDDIKSTASKLRSDHRHSFAGKLLQVVYTFKISYPKAAIEAEVPERYLVKVRKESETWGIRKTAK
jgi:hypothetical protein